MRAVAALRYYPPGVAIGAFLATAEWLTHLAAAGHQVDVVGAAGETRTVDGVTVHGDEPDELLEHADVVISHYGDLGWGAELAARHDLPSVRIAHSTVHNPIYLDGAELVVFAAEHLQVNTLHRARSVVVHPVPAATPADVLASPTGEVTLVNLAPAKGGRLLWLLAGSMPRHRFCGVAGGWGDQYIPERTPANTRVVGQVDDIHQLWPDVAVLMVPSLHESFGRVALEAAGAGVPIIAHPTPGLREALGPAAHYAHRDDTEAWAEAIRRLAQPEPWARASVTSLQVARDWQDRRAGELARFVAALEEVAHGQAEDPDQRQGGPGPAARQGHAAGAEAVG